MSTMRETCEKYGRRIYRVIFYGFPVRSIISKSSTLSINSMLTIIILLFGIETNTCPYNFFPNFKNIDSILTLELPIVKTKLFLPKPVKMTGL